MTHDQTEREIHLRVCPGSGGPDDLTAVYISFDSEEADDFHYLMPAAEYLVYLVATRSNLGFEKALELLVKGAMTWRTRRQG